MSELEFEHPADESESLDSSLHEPLWQSSPATISGVRVGVLVGMVGDELTPLVVFPGQRGSAAVSARSTVQLHEAHVGRDVVLMFEDGDPSLPIVMGLLTAKTDPSPLLTPGHIEVEADGQRMQVSAQEQLVLRCGKASITLTKAGKILLHGTYVSSRSSGVNRIKGGSVQIN